MTQTDAITDGNALSRCALCSPLVRSIRADRPNAAIARTLSTSRFVSGKERARGWFGDGVRSIDIDCHSVSATIPGRDQVTQEPEGVIVMGLMGAPYLSDTESLSHAHNRVRVCRQT